MHKVLRNTEVVISSWWAGGGHCKMGSDCSYKVLYHKSKWFYWASELRRFEGLKTYNITHWLDEVNVITSEVYEYTLSNWSSTNQGRNLQDKDMVMIISLLPWSIILHCAPLKRDEVSPKEIGWNERMAAE